MRVSLMDPPVSNLHFAFWLILYMIM
uniref:Uncharacterized protein n=1 Tax=Rhizophora mucronata TaxID=61149 RepID=A0A2P2NPI8_RHIMU